MKDVVIDSLAGFYLKLPLIFAVTVLIGMCILSANALPSLQLSPTSISINAIQGQIIQKTINLTNTGDMSMFNITFAPQNNITYSNIPVSLAKNQTASITMNIQATNMNVNPLIQFYYKLNTTSTPKQLNVTVSSSFNPITTTARQGDSIMWKNTANSTRRVTQTSFIFDFTLSPNATGTYITTSQGNLGYFENSGYGFGGTIVTNSNIIESNVHNSALDKNMPITVTASQSQTTVSMQIFLTSVSLAYNEAIGNALTIINTGNSTANNVFLTGKWSNFNATTYTIIPQQTKFIQFNTIPFGITQTSQTNKTYVLEINVSGANIPTVRRNMSVFIKYHKFNGTNSTIGNGTVVIIRLPNNDELKAICLQTPGICPTQLQNNTLYIDMPHKVNVTTSLVEQAFNNYANWSQTNQRLENNLNSQVLQIKDIQTQQNAKLDDMTMRLIRMEVQQNKTYEITTKLEHDRFWRNFWLMTFLIIAGIISAIIFFLRKKMGEKFGQYSAGGET